MRGATFRYWAVLSLIAGNAPFMEKRWFATETRNYMSLTIYSHYDISRLWERAGFMRKDPKPLKTSALERD